MSCHASERITVNQMSMLNENKTGENSNEATRRRRNPSVMENVHILGLRQLRVSSNHNVQQSIGNEELINCKS